jgi:hypothetical protein
VCEILCHTDGAHAAQRAAAFSIYQLTQGMTFAFYSQNSPGNKNALSQKLCWIQNCFFKFASQVIKIATQFTLRLFTKNEKTNRFLFCRIFSAGKKN